MTLIAYDVRDPSSDNEWHTLDADSERAAIVKHLGNQSIDPIDCASSFVMFVRKHGEQTDGRSMTVRPVCPAPYFEVR